MQTFPLLVLAASLATAASPASKSCMNFTVPVNVNSRNGVFNNLPVPLTNPDATLFAQKLTRQGSNLTAQALTGYANVQGTYSISAQYCTTGNTPSTVQLLTHGIGFDKAYWDLPFNGFNYSYVDTAIQAGYGTLAIDRLGIGKSSHGEPRNEIQIFIEVEALAEMTRLLRGGRIPQVPAPKKVVHVGHSFGSAQTYSLAAKYPDLSDGIVLTGFSTNSSFISSFVSGADFQQAQLNQPLRFGSKQTVLGAAQLVDQFGLTDAFAPVDLSVIQPLNYSLGYLTNSNAGAGQYLFLLPPYIDPAIGPYSEATKQPVTIGELLTVGSVPMMNAFAKPVLVFTGSADQPFCGGDCLATGGKGTSIPAAASMALPRAKPFQAYIQPNTGHGLNFHYNATAGYRYIQNFLQANNLS